MKLLTTGAAGFIGFHTSLKLLERGDAVIGVEKFVAWFRDYHRTRAMPGRFPHLHHGACKVGQSVAL